MTSILMVVNNPGLGDWRVVKQAEQFVEKGWQCTVLGVQRPGFVAEEVVSGVRYIRVPFKRNFSSLLISFFPVLVDCIWSTNKLLPSNPSADANGRGSVAGSKLNVASDFVAKCLGWSRSVFGLFERKFINYFRGSKILHPVFVRMTFGAYVQSFIPAIKRLEFDIIQAHEIWALESCVLGARGKPVIYDSHELETHRNLPWTERSRAILGFVERKYIYHVAHVSAVSPGCVKYLRRLYRLKSISVLRNLPLLSWLTGTSGSLRVDLKLSDADPLLVYTGNVTLNRGVECVLDALKYLDGVHFACVGNCNAEVRRGLEERAQQLGIEKRVHFVPPVPPGSLPEYISSANLAVLPVLPTCLSYRYCLPNKLFEAIHSNLQILANYLPDVKRIVEEHGIGAVCDFSDSREVARLVCEMIAKPCLYQEDLGARYSFEREFDCFFQRCESVYEKRNEKLVARR